MTTITGELELEGFKFPYQLSGTPNPDLPPVFFVSGAFQNMAAWKRYEKAFAPLTQVILADLPGMGKTEILPYQYGFEFLASGLNKVLTTLKINKVYLVAASYGTPLAYHFACEYPHKIHKLALVGTMKEIPAKAMKHIIEGLFYALKRNSKNFIEEALTTLLNQKAVIIHQRLASRLLQGGIKEMTERDYDRFYNNTLRLICHSDTFKQMSPPSVKTLMFTGECDAFTQASACKAMAQTFDDCLFTTIKDADHLCHLERFKTTVELFQHFLLNKSMLSIKNCNPIQHFVNHKEIFDVA